MVYPPVDTEFFRPGSQVAERSALVVSALVPYKRIEVAIEACALAGVPLTIAGEGPDRARLERLAGPTVTFLGRVSDRELAELYSSAGVTLLPGEEDFGIVPLEAQACGRPVVAYGRGGARETVVDGVTGTLVDDPSAAAFARAISHTMTAKHDGSVIRAHAERFSRTRFGDEMEALIHAESA